MSKTQIEKPPSNDLIIKVKSSSPVIQSNKLLFQKYSSFYYSYDNIQINNLVFNEKSRVVSLFKDYLIYDDYTDFLRRFYSKEENPSRLARIFSFFETYSKIFPNYMILPESSYLYRNIRKKQKMIDAFNQIKREEEENRLNLNIEKKSWKQDLVIFDNSIQNSIRHYEPSRTGNNVDESLHSFSISLSMRKLNANYMSTPSENNLNEESNASLAMIIQTMNNPLYECEPTPIAETPKRIKKIAFEPIQPCNKKNNEDNDNDNDNDHQTKGALNNNRIFIRHKVAASNPELQANKEIQIITNYHNIILPEGSNAVININTNYYQCHPENNRLNQQKNPANNNIVNLNKSKEKDKSVSPNHKLNSLYEKEQIISTFRQKSAKPVNAGRKYAQGNYSGAKSLKKDLLNLEKHKSKDFNIGNSFKSPEKKLNDFPIALSKTKTVNSGNHIMPFYKNKPIPSSTLTELQNKVNPFKIKFEKKFQTKNRKQAFVSSFSSSKKSYDIPAYKKKELKITITEVETNKGIILQTDGDQQMSKDEMKQRYKHFMEKSKKDAMTMRNSCDTNRKQPTPIDNTTATKNPSVSIYVSNTTQRKSQNFKTSYPRKYLLSPKVINFNTIESKIPMTTKIKLSTKLPLRKETSIQKNNISSTINTNNNPSKVIKSINFKALDVNTKKMKFIKK